MTGITRRSWLKNATLGGGLAMFGGLGLTQTLTAAEIKKYNPRPLDGPIRLGSNENPYGPSESVRKAMSSHFDLGCRYPWSYNDDLVRI